MKSPKRRGPRLELKFQLDAERAGEILDWARGATAKMLGFMARGLAVAPVDPGVSGPSWWYSADYATESTAHGGFVAFLPPARKR